MSIKIDTSLIGKLVQVEKDGIIKSGFVSKTGSDSGNTGYSEIQTEHPYVILRDDDDNQYYKVLSVIDGRGKKNIA